MAFVLVLVLVLVALGCLGGEGRVGPGELDEKARSALEPIACVSAAPPLVGRDAVGLSAPTLLEV